MTSDWVDLDPWECLHKLWTADPNSREHKPMWGRIERVLLDAGYGPKCKREGPGPRELRRDLRMVAERGPDQEAKDICGATTEMLAQVECGGDPREAMSRLRERLEEICRSKRR